VAVPDESPIVSEDREERKLLARRLRQLRRDRSLTTRQLAEEAGVSASMISLIETERSGASITTLRKMATALGVPVVEFLVDPERAPDHGSHRWSTTGIVRRQDRRKLRSAHDHSVIELLSPDTNRQIELVWFELAPEQEFNEGMMSHPGEEQALVISGTMHLSIGDETFVLNAGDSIAFDCSIPHRVENRGTERLVQVSAITPPRY